MVLAGGGSRGAYQAGAMIGLAGAGYRPDIIIGTSVGAINGAYLLAAQDSRHLAEVWTRIRLGNVIRFRFDVWLFWRWRSIGWSKPLRRLLKKEIDFERLHQTRTQFMVTTVDLCCARARIFKGPEVDLDVLMAAAAIPGIFPPVEIDGHVYVDGGVLGVAPVRHAIEAGADEVVVILNDRRDQAQRRAPQNLPQVLVRVADIRAQYEIQHDLRRSQEVNEMIERGIAWKEQRFVGLHLLEPRQAALDGILSFHPQRLRERVAQGEEDGRLMAARLRPPRPDAPVRQDYPSAPPGLV